MPATIAGAAVQLDALRAAISHVSAHTAAPGDGGTNEATGAPYVRQAMSFNPASAKNIDSDVVPDIPIPGGVTITHIAFWNASTAGNCLHTIALSSSKTDTEDWILRLDDVDIGL